MRFDDYNRVNENSVSSYEVRKAAAMKRRAHRRAIVMRRRIFAVICGLALIGILSVCFHTIKSNAGSGKEKMFKYYTGIEVEYGDTLWTIADCYSDKGYTDKKSFIKEVKSINHINNTDTIIAGKMLIIPYYSSEYIAD